MGAVEIEPVTRNATTSPGTCNDSFGTRAPATGGSALGSGTSSTSFSESISGLTPATTYYFCAIAENSVGTSFGDVLTFTTPGAPSVTSQPATAVTSDGATAFVSSGQRVFRVDLASGDRFVLADTATGNGDVITNFGALELDAGNNLLFGWNATYESVLIIDLETSDRVIRSR